MRFEDAVKLLGGPIKPSPGEEKNGWTEETLTIYKAERERANRDAVLNTEPKQVDRTENKFRWP